MENTVINENIAENNVTAENEIKEQQTDNKEENTTKNQTHEQEITTEEEYKEEEDSKNKALRLVKEDWGEDDTVYYTIDNQNGNTYFITVRSKSTTGSLAEYDVNVSTNTVTLK